MRTRDAATACDKVPKGHGFFAKGHGALRCESEGQDMRRIVFLFAMALMLVGSGAMADDVPNPDNNRPKIRQTLTSARNNIIAILSTDAKLLPRQPRDSYLTSMDNATRQIDKILLHPTGDKPVDEALGKFRGIWLSFKKTREEVLVPAVLAGDIDQAHSLADGIQKKRVDDMLEILNSIIKTQ
ncbi:MAG: hypothetical protein HQL37_04090 [Alphaproteobacteria bacterium]|nr:hypothetical protein [Alphaproteobacteria bacterium]